MLDSSVVEEKKWYKAQLRKVTDLPVVLFEKTGFSPAGVTILAFLVGMANWALFVWTESVALLATLTLFSGWLDTMDGALARRTNRVTKFGGYFDAMCDRLADGLGGLAVAIVTGHWIPVMLGVVIADSISYAKARTAVEVPIGNRDWGQLMERAERAIAVLIGLAVWRWWPDVRVLERDLFFWWMCGLNVVMAVTLLQRIGQAKRIIADQERPVEPGR